MKHLFTAISILLIVFAIMWLGMNVVVRSHEIELQKQQSMAECANSAHTWDQCNKFWISSGEYKRGINEDYSPEWKEFIKQR